MPSTVDRTLTRIERNSSAPFVRVGCVVTSGYSASEVARDAAVLDNEERAVFQRFHFDAERRDYAAAHALLRTMLSELTPDVAPEDRRFARTPSGKLLLASPSAAWVGLSLSHGRGIVACAVSRDVEVGIDAECDDRRLDVEVLAGEACSGHEQGQLRAAPFEARMSLFLDFWTLKEVLQGIGGWDRIGADAVGLFRSRRAGTDPHRSDEEATSLALPAVSPDSDRQGDAGGSSVGNADH
jgi:phosphopantetheinyl transferase